MSVLIWVGPVALVLILLLWNRLAPSMASLVRRAAKTGDLDPVLEALTQKRPAAQPTAFNHAIRLLWDMDERPLALRLVRELATRNRDARITQYWLREALTVEPAISREIFSRAFVTEHYQPEVAAQCGPVG
jgi:hypothetical protein